MPGNRPHYGRWPQHDFTSLKKLRPQSVTSRIQPGSDVIVCAEMGEQWGYVGAKSRQRWLFYAYDRLRKTVVAHVFGERTMATLGRLMSLLSPFDVVIWMTDGWPLYESRLKGKLHVISKRYTQRIERHNLNLRQHLARLGRKSLSFSKSVELHDKVIGHYLKVDYSPADTFEAIVNPELKYRIGRNITSEVVDASDIGAALIFDRVLSDTEINSIYEYFKDYYARRGISI